MREFTDQRQPDTADEIWTLQHPPVFTQGQAGKPEHLLVPTSIPVVQCDRGGQITYHGPGQLIAYVMLDIRRSGLGVRDLVIALEQCVVEVLAHWHIVGNGRRDAPGVYVDGQKIAALGLRVRKGRTYHGLSLNVDMNLAPFEQINPCGLVGQAVTSMAELGQQVSVEQVRQRLTQQLVTRFG